MCCQLGWHHHGKHWLIGGVGVPQTIATPKFLSPLFVCLGQVWNLWRVESLPSEDGKGGVPGRRYKEPCIIYNTYKYTCTSKRKWYLASTSRESCIFALLGVQIMPHLTQFCKALQGDRRTLPPDFAAMGRLRIGIDTRWNKPPNNLFGHDTAGVCCIMPSVWSIRTSFSTA